MECNFSLLEWVAPVGGPTLSYASFAATVQLERPWLKVRAIAAHPTLPGAALMRILGAQLAQSAPFSRTRHDERQIGCFATLTPQRPAEHPPRRVALGRDDVVLVTGGAKGITAECALALGKQTGAQLVLVGSSPESSVQAALLRFRDEQVRCSYFCCDVSQAAEVHALVDRVRGEIGTITAVVHGAGLNHPQRLGRPEAAQVLAEIAPKLLGGWNLLDALAERPPRLFVALTSVIGVTGMPGNAWYALANECLDLAVGDYAESHPDTDVLSLAYSVWGEVGMGKALGKFDTLARMGVDMISLEEGTSRFVRLIEADPGTRQVVITGRLGDLATWTALTPPPAPRVHPMLGEILRHQPGVELLTQIRLTLAEHAYLQDHCFRGSYLFPTVFGLEAMARSAAALCDLQAFRSFQAEDIRLERPIVVDPDKGLLIRVHACLDETLSPEGSRRVRISIRSEQTDFRKDHFSAVVLVDLDAAEQQETAQRLDPSSSRMQAGDLDIDASADLYGRILFQGERFQRLTTIDRLTDRECAFAALWSPRPGMLIGDPYLIDALLQSPQVSLTPEIGLPFAIESIRIRGLPSGDDTVPLRVRGRATIAAAGADSYRADVVATDPSGQLIASLRGYVIRTIERRDDLPSATQLIAQAQLQREIHGLVQAASAALGCRAPFVRAQVIAGITTRDTAARHRLELPLLAATARLAIEAGGTRVPLPRIAWLPGGKPHIEDVADIGLSLSHSDDTCFCVAGAGVQGCDLARVEARPSALWHDMLTDGAMAIATRLEHAGYAPDDAATLVWAVQETLFKATGLRLHDDGSMTVRAQAVSVRSPSLPAATHIVAALFDRAGVRYALCWTAERPGSGDQH